MRPVQLSPISQYKHEEAPLTLGFVCFQWSKQSPVHQFQCSSISVFIDQAHGRHRTKYNEDDALDAQESMAMDVLISIRCLFRAFCQFSDPLQQTSLVFAALVANTPFPRLEVASEHLPSQSVIAAWQPQRQWIPSLWPHDRIVPEPDRMFLRTGTK